MDPASVFPKEEQMQMHSCMDKQVPYLYNWQYQMLFLSACTEDLQGGSQITCKFVIKLKPEITCLISYQGRI